MEARDVIAAMARTIKITSGAFSFLLYFLSRAIKHLRVYLQIILCVYICGCCGIQRVKKNEIGKKYDQNDAIQIPKVIVFLKHRRGYYIVHRHKQPASISHGMAWVFVWR